MFYFNRVEAKLEKSPDKQDQIIESNQKSEYEVKMEQENKELKEALKTW